MLSSTCINASVYSMPEDGQQFWLVEDHEEGVTIGLYDAQTLEARPSPHLLPEMHLLSTRQEERPLPPGK